MRGDMVGVLGEERGLNCSKERGEGMEDVEAEGDVELLGVEGSELNGGGIGMPLVDRFCITASSLISFATSAITCSTGTFDVPSGICCIY